MPAAKSSPIAAALDSPPSAHKAARRRTRRPIAGVTVPLFSLRSERSWGIGEIGDLPDFAAWIAEAGLRLVQLLPLGEIAGSETSPYFALSAFGIDPMYISIEDIPDLSQEEVAAALGDLVARLEPTRARPTVDYAAVRALKGPALRAAFERFSSASPETPQEAFRTFVAAHEAWLPDYALFRAIKDARGGTAWYEWPEPLSGRDPAALAEARAAYAEEVRYYEYVQWIAHTQWEAARARLRAMGVEIMGDLPFMVSRDSADVWAHQDEFRTDMAVGVPPDQFSEGGQDWGLPPYWWDRMRKNGFAWLRRRARYMGTLYDRFRIDHLVGFYRTYMRPEAARVDAAGKLVKGTFDPKEEKAQLAHGEQVMRAMIEGAAETGARIVAEDLGPVPAWVRRSLTRLGVPGYKVVIWEKEWEEEGRPFIDPATYPELSVACYDTHDTDPVAAWWASLDDEERAALLALPELAGRREALLHAQASDPQGPLAPEAHSALLDLILASGSELVLLLMQDVLGTQERINTPGTMSDHNWTYRLPGTPAEMRGDPEISAALARVRASVQHSGRGGG